MKKLDVNGKIILAIECWWGHYDSGCNGYVLTDEKKLYNYQEYYRRSSDSELNYCYDRKITEDKYQEILNWIDKNIAGKDFEFRDCKDMGKTICINYSNKDYVIINHFELYDEIENIIKK